MRRTIGRYHCEYFKMPHLFRDDLEKIEKIVQSELKPKAYEIGFDGVEYESVEAIETDQECTHVLVLASHQPCLRLKLSRSWAELYCGEAGPHIDAAVQKITAIVRRSERRSAWVFTKYATWLAPLIGFGGIAQIMGLIALEKLTSIWLWAGMVLLLVCAVWWGLGHRYGVYAFSCVELQKRRKS